MKQYQNMNNKLCQGCKSCLRFKTCSGKYNGNNEDYPSCWQDNHENQGE